MLETFAAGLAIERLDEAGLGATEAQVKRARMAGRSVDAEANFDLGLAFHDVRVAASGNRKVVQFHENLRRHQRRYQHFAFARLGRDVKAIDEISPLLPVEAPRP